MLFVCMCVCINCVYFFVFFFECVGVLPFDGEIKMYIVRSTAIARDEQISVDYFTHL